jgi:hypothetical protein
MENEEGGEKEIEDKIHYYKNWDHCKRDRFSVFTTSIFKEIVKRL